MSRILASAVALTVALFAQSAMCEDKPYTCLLYTSDAADE